MESYNWQWQRDAVFDDAENRPITLDGQPARLRGRKLQFPSISNATTDVTFAWKTVARILDGSRAFKS